MYGKYISPLGYQTDEDEIDSYGVDHKSFSLRDELEYQNARVNRKQKLMNEYKNQGITKDYPQHATNFWGTNADNNYGFGKSDISSNIENVMTQNSNTQANPNYISDEDLQAKMRQNIKAFEDVMGPPYIDPKG